MKFKAPGRRKKNKSVSNDEAVAAAEPAPAAEQPPAAEDPTVAEEPKPETEPTPEDEQPAEPAAEAPVDEQPPAAEPEPEPTTEVEPELVELASTSEPEQPMEDIPEDYPEDLAATPTAPDQEPDMNVGSQPSLPAIEVEGPEDGDMDFNDHESDDISVELAPIPPLFGVLKKGPYMAINASPKTARTLRKQKWSSQFCRIDPVLWQIFCCDKDRGKLYENDPPVETDGKCMFFHINVNTTVEEAIEEDVKVKDFTFKITGLNGARDSTLTLSTATREQRGAWVKIIKRTVNRIHIDKDRLGDHTKLRQMLTGQEAEISILEEELEKMAVVAGECSGRAYLAEEKLKLKDAECLDHSSKLQRANIEIASLRCQLQIMEDRTRNLNILADDVHGVSAEEVEAARAQMQTERSQRLRAIQLEVGGDEDYLEKYKKYLNLKRDAILQKHGSQFSINSVGAPKFSPTY